MPVLLAVAGMPVSRALSTGDTLCRDGEDCAAAGRNRSEVFGVVVTGAEIAAVGRVLSTVARSAATSDGGPASAAQRTAAYIEFQAAVFALLTWVETTEAIQSSVPPPWQDTLAAVPAVASVAAYQPGTPIGDMARAFRPVLLIAYAGRFAGRVEHARAVRSDVLKLRDITARVLASLAQVRLVGGLEPRASAEDVVALLGEMLTQLPVVRDAVLGRMTMRHPRHDELREGVGHHLRRFIQDARRDLSKYWWRRRSRASWWTFYRPKSLTDTSEAPNVDALLLEAKQAGQGSERQ